MNKILLSLLFFTITITVFAQSGLTPTQQQVWGNAGADFAESKIPEKYTKESAVVIARSYTKVCSKSFSHWDQTTLFHEKVKINDKPALEKFSTLEYQKKEEQTSRILFFKLKNVKNISIGVKIVKPDGKEVIINTSEEVILNNNKTDKQGKLAVPGLQVGDIIDYFVHTTDTKQDNSDNDFKGNENLVLLRDEYPVMSYSLYFQFGKKYLVKWHNANGAPKFTETTNKDDDRIFTMRVNDVPKYENQLWTSPYRQYPYVQISSVFNYTKAKEVITDNMKGSINTFKFMFNELYFKGFDDPEKKLKEHFDGNKGLKNATLDSTMKVLYDIWRYNVFDNYVGTSADDVSTLNYRIASSKVNTVSMSLLLMDMKIDHDVLVVSSRNNSSLDNAFNTDDLSFMIRVNNNGKPLYMCFYDALTHFNEIPAQFQGEKVITLKPKRHSSTSFSFIEGEGVLPVTPSQYNRVEQIITVTLPAANPQKVQLNRVVKQTGYLRHDDQRSFLNAGDIDKYLADKVQGEELAKRLKVNSEVKKISDAILSGMNKSVVEINKVFSAEIQSEFDQEPQALTNCKIINPAFGAESPIFEFSSSFTLDNMVKKAGNNYIVDAGKLTGGFLKLEEKDRKRTADIYMPGARSFKYTININVPKGYRVKGIDELKKQKSNSTGSFTSTATLNGSVINISVNRVYNNNFEKAADWPLVTELIAVAAAFSDQKILFEKEG